jgi:anti-sigma factor RsiW
MDCQAARTTFHETPTDSAVQAHLQGCPACAAYAARFARLDQVLPSTLVVSAPPALSARLQNVLEKQPLGDARLEAAVHAELVRQAPPELTTRLQALVQEHRRLPARVDATLRQELMSPVPAELTARLQALVSTASASVPQPRRWVVGTVYLLTAATLLFGLMFASSIYHLMLTQLGLEVWWSEVASLPSVLLDQLYFYVPQSRVVVGAIVWLQQPLQWLLAALLLWAVLDRSQAYGGRRYA